jgi:hypothetical protein
MAHRSYHSTGTAGSLRIGDIIQLDTEDNTREVHAIHAYGINDLSIHFTDAPSIQARRDDRFRIVQRSAAADAEFDV